MKINELEILITNINLTKENTSTFDSQWTIHSSLIISINIVPFKPSQNINLLLFVTKKKHISIQNFPILFDELFTSSSFTPLIHFLNLHTRSSLSQPLILLIPIHAYVSFFNNHQCNNDKTIAPLQRSTLTKKPFVFLDQ